MKSLEFSLVGSCSLDCHFCPQAVLKEAYSGPKQMFMPTFDAILRNAGKVDVYSFAGFAEPYFHPNCSTMIRACAELATVQLYTTGVGMTPADVERITGRVDWITVHLPDAAGNMKFKPSPLYLETLAALKKSGMDVRWMAMGQPHPDVLPITGKIPAVLMQSRAGNVKHMVQLTKYGSLKCGPAPELDHPVVLPDGAVVLCCQSYNLRHTLGNLATQTWAEIYAGEPFRELKAAMESEAGDCLCRGCSYSEKR